MNISIPGLKVLDEIIAGLPTNSGQRLELAKLRSEIEVKDKRLAELEAELSKVRPPTGVPADAVKILQLFFETDRDLHPEEIAQHLGMKPSIVRHHIDTLSGMDFVQLTNVDGSYSIYPAGRSFIVKHGLA